MRDVTLLDTEHKVSISIDNETQEIDIKKIKKLYTYIDLNESLNTALENDIILDAYIYCSNEPPTTINEDTEVNEENVTHRDIIDSDGTVMVTIYNGDNKYYEENILFKQGHIIHAIPNDLPLGTYEMSIEYLGGKYFEPYTLDVFFDIEKRLGTCTFDKEIYYGNLGDTITIQGTLTDKERDTPVKDCIIKYEFNEEEDQEVTTHIDGDFYIHVQIPEPDVQHCLEFSDDIDESEIEVGDPYVEEYENAEYLWIDEGTINNHKESWYNYESILTVDYPEQYNATRVRKTEDNTTQRYYYYNDNAISEVQIDGLYTITTPSIIEFDVLSYVGTIQLSLYDGANQVIKEISGNGYYKIECRNGVVKFYKNNIEMPHTPNTLNGNNYRFGFGFSEHNEGVVFKDFIIRVPSDISPYEEFFDEDGNIIENHSDIIYAEYANQEYVSIEDDQNYLWFDKGIKSEHKTTWYNYESTLTVDYPSIYNATRVRKTENNNTQRYYYYNDNTISTTQIGGYNTITTPSVIEFDVLSYVGTIQLSLYDGTNHVIQEISDNGHYRILCDGFIIKFYKDGVEIPNSEKIFNGNNYRFGFGFSQQNEGIVFRNFIIRLPNFNYLWVDRGTINNHKNSWYNYNSLLTVDYPELYDATRVRKTEDNTTQRYYYYNDTSISTVKIGGYNSITTPSVIEFDVLSYAGNTQLSLYDGTHQVIQEISEKGHYKIECNGSTVKFYKDGIAIPDSEKILNGENYRFGFGFNAKDEGITFKNFIIHSLDEISLYEEKIMALTTEENILVDDDNNIIDDAKEFYPEDIYVTTYPNATYIINLYTDNESYNINDTKVLVVANKAPTQVVGTSANQAGEASNILKINGSVLADYLNKDNNVKYGKVQIELPDYNYSEKADINNGGFSHNIDLTHLYDLYNVDESNEITTYNTADDMHPNITITSDDNEVSVGDTFTIKAKVEATAPDGTLKAVPYGVLVFKMFKQGTDTLIHQYATEISTTGEGTFSFNPTNKINYEISVQYIGIFGYNDVTASTKYKVSVK